MNPTYAKIVSHLRKGRRVIVTTIKSATVFSLRGVDCFSVGVDGHVYVEALGQVTQITTTEDGKERLIVGLIFE